MHELTKDQNIASDGIISSIISSIKDNKPQLLSLVGPAGTGKTYLTRYIIKELQKHNFSIHCSAPTHKAVKVIKQTLCGVEDDTDMMLLPKRPITFSTIHAFLKLKLQPNLLLGIHELVQNNFEISKSDTINCDVLIVDEMSMISKDLLHYIALAVKNKRVKCVLLIGDAMQLKPVDGIEVDVINITTPFYLNEVVRQAKQNPIIVESITIREAISTGNFPKLSNILATNNNKITIFNDSQEFTNDFINNATDDKVITSFTNAAVDTYNKNIRYQLKGDIENIISGDILIFQEAFEKDRNLVYANNDDITVDSAIMNHDAKLGIDFWTIFPTTETGKTAFDIVDFDSIPIWNEHLAKLKQWASESSTEKKKQAWRFYFSQRAKYAYVKYHYASTIHKLQGSTYSDVYFDYRSLVNNRSANMDTIFRLIYVAITRASNSIKILR